MSDPMTEAERLREELEVWHGDMKPAGFARKLDALLAAVRDCVIEATVRWCAANQIDDYPDGDETLERYLARARAALNVTKAGGTSC